MSATTENIHNQVFYKSLEEMLSNSSENHTFFVQYWKSKKCMIYTSFENISSFEKFQEQIPQAKRHFCEIMRPQNPMREYYDIDLSVEDFSGYPQQDGETLEMWRERLVLEFLNVRNEYRVAKGYIDERFKNSINDCYISEACSDIKFSVHIVCENWFACLSELKAYIDDFTDYSEGKCVKFDRAVYSKNRAMRMIGNSKPDDSKRVLRVYPLNSLSRNGKMEMFMITNQEYMKKHPNNQLEIDVPVVVKKPKVDVEIDDNTITEIQELVEFLSKERADSYDSWSKVGWCLYSLCPNLDGEWHEFSSKSQKYDERACQKFWDSCEKGDYTIASLHAWAKLDSPKEYKEWMKGKLPQIIKRMAENRVEINFSDPSYTWGDFELEANQRFDTFEDMLEFVKNNYPRVCGYISEGKGEYVKKCITEDGTVGFNVIGKADMTLQMKYKELIAKGKNQTSVDKQISIKEFNSLIQYKRIGYYPQGLERPSDSFNIATNFVAREVMNPDYKSIEPILFHLKEVWADGDEECFQYILKMLRNIVKFPNYKQKVAIVIQSSQGAGKGIITKFLREFVIGNELTSCVSGLESITGKFNSIIARKALVVVDELSSAKDCFHTNFDTLKNLITEDRIKVEPKGRDAINIHNYSSFILFTNHKMSFKLEKGDRRYFAIQASDRFVGNVEYFKSLEKSMTKENGDVFYSYLLNEVQGEKGDEVNFPKSNFREELIMLSLSTPEKFWNDFKRDFDATTITYKYVDDRIAIKGADVYNMYRNWCHQNGENAMSATKMNALLPIKEKKVVKINNKAEACSLFDKW